MPLSHRESNAQIVQALAERVRQIEHARRPAGALALVPSGLWQLDRLLPENAFRRGTLVEWLAAGSGSGAVTLALLVARQAHRQGGALVVIDRQKTFYPPAAAAWGIDLERMIVVHPSCESEESWALDQALRFHGVAAVLAWPGKGDDPTFRRWQLAAEASGTLGLLIRAAAVRSQPSWADLRLLVTPLPSVSRGMSQRRFTIELLRCRGGVAGGAVEVELSSGDEHHEENSLHLAASMAASTTRRRARGA